MDMGAKLETLHNIVGYDSKDLFQIIHLKPRTFGMATVSWNVASTFCTYLPYNKFFKNVILTMDFACR